MNRSLAIAILVLLGVALTPPQSHARGFGGFGGGFHAGGYGGYGGYHAGGGEAGGYHEGGYGGYGGYHAGGFEAGGYHAGGFEGSEGYHAGGLEGGGGSSLDRGQLNSFLGLPTDGGMHAAGGAYGSGFAASPEGAFAGRAGAEGHVYQGPMGTTVAHGTAGAQGAAVGPEGAAAGGAFASGTAIQGPEGNTYTHSTTGARGFAAGPEGVEGGREFASGSTLQGAGGTTVSRGVSGAQGFAAGPEGVAAGSRVAGGTAAQGPAGNVYAQGTAAGRGFAARPYGAVAGGGYVAAGGYAQETHAWSPTYYHAQALAGQGWFAANPVFTGGWTAAHPWPWCPGAVTPAAWTTAAWSAATWPTVGAWLGWNSTTPYAYNYGDNIVYQNGNVYYGSQPAGTTGQYYQQSAELATSGVDAQTSPDTQWLPLGVFGLMPPNAKTPSYIVQLAVDKSGVVRGNCYEEATKQTMPLQGAVDKKTQRVAWRTGDNQDMVVEMGLYSLTQNEATALVHFGSNKTVQYLLMRLHQPAGTQQASQ